MPKPLPLGEVALPNFNLPRGEEGRSLSVTIECKLLEHPALSVGLAPASSPQRGASGKPVNFLLDA